MKNSPAGMKMLKEEPSVHWLMPELMTPVALAPLTHGESNQVKSGGNSARNSMVNH